MKKLYIDRSEYIWHFLGFEGTSEGMGLAQWFVDTLIDNGKIEIDVEENFKVRDNIPLFMIDVDDEELEEFLEDEFLEDVPLEFEFKGEKYQLELEK